MFMNENIALSICYDWAMLGGLLVYYRLFLRQQNFSSSVFILGIEKQATVPFSLVTFNLVKHDF